MGIVVGMVMSTLVFPTRTNVRWDKNENGLITIFQEKKLGSFEKRISKIFGAPTEVKRPLDEMNSALWLLMDGTNNLSQIIAILDDLFAEKIAPAPERISKSIAEFRNLGLVDLVKHP